MQAVKPSGATGARTRWTRSRALGTPTAPRPANTRGNAGSESSAIVDHTTSLVRGEPPVPGFERRARERLERDRLDHLPHLGIHPLGVPYVLRVGAEASFRRAGVYEPLPVPGGGPTAVAAFVVPSRSSRWSPTLKAFAMIVSAGFTAAEDGKKLASTT